MCSFHRKHYLKCMKRKREIISDSQLDTIAITIFSN
ncbi:unnamed protein product [Spirodela intermedia]|uniref:Uncharacterized protein n=2 Tax=Spirodela intermedia TaxID=51605 RepID=A0A7I8I8K2_SPIIN|nr:unnamed protein product [Spirodela intermedia]CAA6653753.1 unnamed protein product [Spirodela intermedia]CAA7388114.1 unnamed protein product [Spirodela intermedia]